MRFLLVPVCALMLTGCVSMVKDVVTAPVKVVGKTADWLTTSQSEKDEKRGREMRKKEEELGRIARKRDEARRKCTKGDSDACAAADDLDQQIQDLI